MALKIGNGVNLQPNGAQTAEYNINIPRMTQSARMPLMLYNQDAAGTAHTNTTTEALAASYTMPANTLFQGAKLRIRFQGIATATNSSDTLTVKLYIGGLTGTALLTSSSTDATDNDVFQGECELTCRTVGATGTFVAVGTFTKVEAASGTATNVVAITASTAIDTTASQVIGVGLDWSAASASDSARIDIFSVELL